MPFTVYKDLIIDEATPVLYLGDPSTDGSWRIIIDGTDLSIQRREAGSWVEKSVVPA